VRSLPAALRLSLLAAALALSAARPAAAQIPASASWRTLDTPHFRVYFPAELEPLARRAAAYAEDAREQLAGALIQPPAGRIDLVVADNVDYSNGYATPFPRNRVVIYANTQVDEPGLAF
jgi:hypothetical protein